MLYEVITFRQKEQRQLAQTDAVVALELAEKRQPEHGPVPKPVVDRVPPEHATPLPLFV